MPTSTGEPHRRPTPYLAVSDLAAGYGAVPVVRDVSLVVGTGEIVTLLGANAAERVPSSRHW